MSGRGTGVTPAPIPAKEARGLRAVLVCGGSFDPPHRQHVSGPVTALERMYGAEGWLLYVPAANSPLKNGPEAGAEHRVEMLRLALEGAGARRCAIWTDEIDRALRSRGGTGAASYTIDTLRRLRGVLPERVSLRLVIGADQAAAFHLWKNPRGVIRLAEPLVMLRPPPSSSSSDPRASGRRGSAVRGGSVVAGAMVAGGAGLDSVDGLWRVMEGCGYWTRAELRKWCGWIAPTPSTEDASTEIRRAIRGARPGWSRGVRGPGEGALGLLEQAVAEYIERHGLYRAGGA